MRISALTALLGTALLTACAPMEQAPLIYTSGVQVGLHVGTGPDKTTPEINIGVNQVDAAYVPVAVAKHCDPKTSSATDCINEIYKLRLIDGNSTIKNSTPPPVDKLQSAVSDYINAKSAVDTMTAKIEALAAKQTAAAAAPVAGATPATPLTQTESDALATDQKALPDLQSTLDSKHQALVDLVTGQPGSSAADQQRDALSVFGTFDSNAGGAGGTSTSGSVVVGHTFSTGIAAQNLTRGQEISAASAAYANCLTAVTALIPKIDTTKTSVDSMVADCGRLQSMLTK